MYKTGNIFIEKLRHLYRQNRGIMFVRKALASGPDENQMAKYEEQPVRSKIELCDMELVDIKSDSDVSSRTSVQSKPQVVQHEPFYRNISSGRKH